MAAQSELGGTAWKLVLIFVSTAHAARRLQSAEHGRRYGNLCGNSKGLVMWQHLEGIPPMSWGLVGCRLASNCNSLFRLVRGPHLPRNADSKHENRFETFLVICQKSRRAGSSMEIHGRASEDFKKCLKANAAMKTTKRPHSRIADSRMTWFCSPILRYTRPQP